MTNLCCLTRVSRIELFLRNYEIGYYVLASKSTTLCGNYLNPYSNRLLAYQ